MPVRQYIGARYVPRFVGLYDVTQSYEPLDVVDNGSGTSYIAKKPTPAGTPLTDTNYWFLYGSTNGAIVNLQQQIDNMKDGTIPGSLQEQINNNASDITDLANKIDRKYIIIGDSYGDPSLNGSNTSVITYLMDMLKLTENVNVTTIYQGGSGFISDGTRTFYNLLTTIDTRFTNNIPNFTRNDVTDIIVFGGCNDNAQTAQALEIAITTFKTYANAHFPNAQIHVGMVGNTRNQTTHFTIGNNVLKGYMAIQNYGGHYLSGVEYVMLDQDNFLTDGVHPTNAGSRNIAGAIYQALDGVYTVNYQQSGNVDFSNSDLTYNSGNISWNLRNDGNQIDIVLFGVASASYSGATINQNIKVGDINCKYLNASLPNGFPFNVGRAIFGSALGTKETNFYVDGKTLYFIAPDNGNIGAIQPLYVHLSFPAMLN